MSTRLTKVSDAVIYNAILFLRSKRVIIDSDLAEFYGVSTKVLNQAVKRKIKRFPDDFLFRLTEKEKQYVVTNCDHLQKLKFSPHLPYAFTEYGAVMAANVINSEIAEEASIKVVRAFIRLSEILSSHKELADKIEKLERNLKNRLTKHDKEIQILFEAIKQLMVPPNPQRKQIGYKYGEKK